MLVGEDFVPQFKPLEDDPYAPPLLRIWHELDCDRLFRKSRDTVILNRFNFSEPGYAQTLSELIFSRAADLDFVARCSCEHLQGNFFIGQECPECHTLVTLDMESATGHLEHKAWLECPEEIKGWLNPSAFFVLSKWLTYGKRVASNYVNQKGEIATRGKMKKGNYLEDILDVSTPNPPEIVDAIPGSGFNYLYDNFDYIMEYFLTTHKKTSTKKGVLKVRDYINKYRNTIFCRYYPVLSSSLHSVVMSEGNRDNRKRYVDKFCQYVQHAAETLSYLKFNQRKYQSITEIEESTYSALQDIIAYTSVIATAQLSAKRAMPRMHMFGSRLHLSFRSVIAPITGRHKIDELHIPYPVGVNTFRPDIIGRLMRDHNMLLKEAYNRQQNALVKFDKLIYEIMVSFIQECPYRGIPVLWIRNPVVRVGGVGLMFVTKIKTDLVDETIAMSSLACPPPNADFDGDAMNGFRIPEMDMVKKFMVMNPSNLYLSRNELKVTNLLTIPKISLLSLNRFLRRV